MKVPPFTICAHKASYSFCEPSIQWIASGWHSAAIFFTHWMRCGFLLRGLEVDFMLRGYAGGASE